MRFLILCALIVVMLVTSEAKRGLGLIVRSKNPFSSNRNSQYVPYSSRSDGYGSSGSSSFSSSSKAKKSRSSGSSIDKYTQPLDPGYLPGEIIIFQCRLQIKKFAVIWFCRFILHACIGELILIVI